MASDTTVLVIVLSSVFGFLFAVFLILILRFTLRVRSMAPPVSRSSTLDEVNISAFPQPRRNLTAKERAEQWKERWSTKSRGDAAAVRGVDDDELEAARHESLDEKTAGEFGAMVGDDGTRSFLNGWFALDSPPTVNAIFKSYPSRGKHERLRTKDAMNGDEWEVKTDVSEDDDPEAYRPQYATI